MNTIEAVLGDARSNFTYVSSVSYESTKSLSSKEALDLMFTLMNNVLAPALEHVARTGSKTYFKGTLDEKSLNNFLILEEIINNDLGLTLRSPFEGCDTIAGNLWEGSKLLNRDLDDAIVKLMFEKQALDLPSHIHSASDRVLVEYYGQGFFHPSFDDYDSFVPSRIESVPIEKGDIICFPRGLIHTFSTMNSKMGDFSYHHPFVHLDDPLQYTITDNIWLPRDLTR